MYTIRENKEDTVVDKFPTLGEAQEALDAYEEADKIHGWYVKNLYSITKE